MAQCTIGELVTTAVHKGHGEASGGRWWSRLEDDGTVTVGHYSTRMLTVDPVTRIAEGISAGWGSMTDKCGIGKIVKDEVLYDAEGERLYSYHQVYS